MIDVATDLLAEWGEDSPDRAIPPPLPELTATELAEAKRPASEPTLPLK